MILIDDRSNVRRHYAAARQKAVVLSGQPDEERRKEHHKNTIYNMYTIYYIQHKILRFRPVSLGGLGESGGHLIHWNSRNSFVVCRSPFAVHRRNSEGPSSQLRRLASLTSSQASIFGQRGVLFVRAFVQFIRSFVWWWWSQSPSRVVFTLSNSS